MLKFDIKSDIMRRCDVLYGGGNIEFKNSSGGCYNERMSTFMIPDSKTTFFFSTPYTKQLRFSNLGSLYDQA